MKYFLFYYYLMILFDYIKNQKPTNMTIFNINQNSENKYYEFAIPEGETFAFQFS